MLSSEQLHFFSTFAGFQASATAQPKNEFGRLAAHRTWKTGGKVYNKHKRAFDVLPDAHLDGYDLANRLGGIHISASERNCSDETKIETVQEAFERFLSEQSRRDGNKRPKVGSKRYNKASARFFADEVQALYGKDEIKLDILQDLCRDAQLEDIPNTITACKKALDTRYINIYDFLNCKRFKVDVAPVFHDYKKFRQHTLDRGLIFNKQHAKQSRILHFLLEHIF